MIVASSPILVMVVVLATTPGGFPRTDADVVVVETPDRLDLLERGLVGERPLARELVRRHRGGEQARHRGGKAREEDHREDGFDQREARIAAQA